MKTTLALILFAASILVTATPAKALNCYTTCAGSSCMTQCH